LTAIDTNVLVRVLVADESSVQQSQLAQALVKRSEAVYVSQVVQIETVWVLESAYGFRKPDILLALRMLMDNRAYQLEQAETFASAVSLFSESNVGFADCLILSGAKARSLELWTFDKKPSKLTAATELTEAALVS